MEELDAAQVLESLDSLSPRVISNIANPHRAPLPFMSVRFSSSGVALQQRNKPLLAPRPPLNSSRVHKAPLSHLQSPARSNPQANSSPRLLTTSLLSDISTAPPPRLPDSRHQLHQPNLPPPTLNNTAQHSSSRLPAILTPTYLPTPHQVTNQPPTNHHHGRQGVPGACQPLLLVLLQGRRLWHP